MTDPIYLGHTFRALGEKLYAGDLFSIFFFFFYIKVTIAANWKGICLQNTSKPHLTILKYGVYYDFMDR